MLCNKAVLLLKTVFSITGAACNWPDPFISSTWIDGFKDDLVFTADRMRGWDIAIDLLVIDEWECFRADRFDSDGYLEMK